MYFVEKTGEYALLFTICGNQTSFVELSGEVTVLNPFGLMGTNKYVIFTVYYLYFYIVISGIYLVLSILWCVVLARHWSVCSHFHLIHVPVMLVLGLSIAPSYYLTWSDLLQTGDLNRLYFWTTLALIYAARAVTRVVITMVAKGYSLYSTRFTRHSVLIVITGAAWFAIKLGHTALLSNFIFPEKSVLLIVCWTLLAACALFFSLNLYPFH